MFQPCAIFHEYSRVKIFDHVDTMKAIGIVLVVFRKTQRGNYYSSNNKVRLYEFRPASQAV